MLFRGSPRSLIAFFLVNLGLLGVSIPASAQDLRARITGIVFDPDGRAVAGAVIRAANLATNVERTTRSNQTGAFSMLYLPSGDYLLSVEADGFRRLLRENLTLGSEDHVALTLHLSLGPVRDSITVSAERPTLATGSASRGSTVAAREIENLPNNGRNVYQLVWAAPGVIKASTYWGSMENFAVGNASSAMINGGIEGENETLLDGVTNTQPNRDINYQPPLESVEEVETLTSVYDASYGRFGGGVIALTTKSGSNSFHGTLHETNKTASLAANPWGLNALGEHKPHFVNNTFGATLSGPIVKSRLFFMGSYEGLRQRASDDDSEFVAPAALREGDFSNHPRTIYDPLTTRAEGGSEVRDPFAGNRIPQSRLDPIALAALAYTPLPNLAGREYPNDNYALFAAEKVDYDQTLFKVDYNVSSADRVYFSYGKLYFTEHDANLFGVDSPADPNRKSPLTRDYERWVADWTRTIGPATTLNLRAGLGRAVETRGNPTARGFDPRDLGFADDLVSRFSFLQFPLFNFQGAYTQIGSEQVFIRDAADSWSYQANLHRSAGRHLLNAGAELRIYNENSRNPGFASGRYIFTRRFTQADPLSGDSASGDELAGFLLGYPWSGSVDSNIDPAFQGRYATLFFQDNWSPHPRLTLNLGVRWDYERPYAERFNRMLAGFAFDQPSPIDAAVPELDLRGGLLFADGGDNLRLASNPDRNNIQPRIGVAWRAGKHWVLRGGYGLYYLGSTGGQPTTGFSAATSLISTVDAGRTPRVGLDNAFPEGLLEPIGSTLGLASRLGQGISFGDRRRVSPYSHQYSLSVQRMLPGGFVLDAAYSGNEIRRYPVDVNLNALPAETLHQPNSYFSELVPNPMEGLIPNNASKNRAEIARGDLLRPYPQYGSLRMSGVSIGRSSYHSLQTRLTRAYSNGLTFNVAYTISKTLEQLNFLNDQDFRFDDPDSSRLERRLAEFDVPQKFAALTTYELPFGKGKPLGSQLRGAAGALISGWRLNSQLTIQSGFPIEFPNAAPLEARSAKLPDAQVTLERAFDTSLFPRTPPNMPLRDFPSRFPDVRLQPLQNLDLSLAKHTRLTERLGLEIRAEFLNATNHPWFSSLHSRGADVTREQFGWYEQEEQNQNRQIALVAKLRW